MTAFAEWLGLSQPGEGDWQERALCAQTDPELWFPDKGGSTTPAKKICADCDVQAECLEFALDNAERYGIYGGKSERERRKMLHARDLGGVA
jgi:WhiB family redox-sensing transcriptional regulator